MVAWWWSCKRLPVPVSGFRDYNGDAEEFESRGKVRDENSQAVRSFGCRASALHILLRWKMLGKEGAKRWCSRIDRDNSEGANHGSVHRGYHHLSPAKLSLPITDKIPKNLFCSFRTSSPWPRVISGWW